MNEKTVLATLAGIADPILKKWAQRLASFVPSGSTIRTKEFESVIGALKGWVEIQAEKFSPASGVAVEKATDFADFFSGALGPQSGLDLEKWAGEVLNEAGPRLKAATDPAAEMERIQLEFKLRKKLAEIIQQEIPAPPPTTNWKEANQQLKNALTEINAKIKIWAEKGDKP